HHVHAVDADPGKAVRLGAACEVAHRDHLLDSGRHRELVVLAEQDQRQLPDRGEVGDLVEGALIEGAVAKEAEGDLAGSAQLGREGGAAGESEAPTDDPVGSKHPDREVCDVHAAALAPAVAVFAAEQLGHHALHVTALGDRVAVASVGTRDVVVYGKGGACTHGHGLLAYGGVTGAPNQLSRVEV